MFQIDWVIDCLVFYSRPAVFDSFCGSTCVMSVGNEMFCIIIWIFYVFYIPQFSDNDKRFLMDTTTSHFGVGNLGAMDLETRVQRLEDENNLEMELLYRVSRELTAVHSEMNATINRDLFSRLSRELSAVQKSLNETIIRQRELDTKLGNMKLGNFSYGKKVLSFEMLIFYIINLWDTPDRILIDWLVLVLRLIGNFPAM